MGQSFTAEPLLMVDVESRFPGVKWPYGAESTIWVSPGVTIGDGTVIEPNVLLEGDTHVGEHCKLTWGTKLIDTRCGDECTFKAVIKRSVIGNRVAVGHISAYFGDATIEDGVNIGAGVITANFDGKNKKKTFIGKDSFIDIGVKFIARNPRLYIGRRTYIAAGVIVRSDVPDDTYVNPMGAYRLNEMKKVGNHWIRKDPRGPE